MSLFNDITRPVAAKPHKCEWCGEQILKDEKHVKFVGMFESDFQSWRQHNECYEDCIEYTDPGEGFTAYENERPTV